MDCQNVYLMMKPYIRGCCMVTMHCLQCFENNFTEMAAVYLVKNTLNQMYPNPFLECNCT